MVSVCIPSRNEPYLKRTILDLLANNDDIEIIAVLDGYWPEAEEFVNDKRVIYIHFSESRGMRAAINAAVSVARGEYILKLDAHCSTSKNLCEMLKAHCEPNWVVVPRRYALNPEKWEIEDNPKYPVDYMYLDKDLHGTVWTEKNKDDKFKSIQIDDLMSSQGSCWFMRRDYFYELELMDEENYGKFSSEFQEIGLKCWLSGGRVVVNKMGWYAHWHKTVGRGYSLSKSEFEKGNNYALKWKNEKVWHKQIHDMKWLMDKFSPLPE